MVDLLRSKTVTARKPHRCSTCRAVFVQPGEKYERHTYAYDGTVYDWLNCPECASLASEIFNWTDDPYEGIGPDDYTMWAEEHLTDPRALAFVRRLGWTEADIAYRTGA